MNKRDMLIKQLFMLTGYCQGVMHGLEIRLRDRDVSDDEILLFANIQNEVKGKTESLLKKHEEILDNE